MMIQSKFLQGLGLGCVALASWLAGSARAATITKVACVGDSITQLSGWPDMLGARLGAAYTSTNYGVSGTTLLKKGDAPYWATPAFTQSHAANPDIVVIMLGTNDSKPFNYEKHPDDFIPDYKAIIAAFRAVNPKVKIYAALPVPAFPENYGIRDSVIVAKIIPAILGRAIKKAVGVLDQPVGISPVITAGE